MNKSDRSQYHKLARNLRNAQTPAEVHLWKFLRQRQIKGYRFRRQTLIGRYIVDFVCFEAKLVVELDGGVHLEQAEYDGLRDAWFISQGFRVLRFPNDDVF